MRTTTALLALLTLGIAGEDRWRTTVVYTAPDRLNGCAVGDLDPDRPGDEIVAVCANGDVVLAYRDDGAWKHDRIARVPGEPIQCAIGDVDPATPGKEIVVAGMRAGGEDAAGPGAVHVLARRKGAWTARQVLTHDGLVHGVCVADLDPARAGAEILCVGFPQHAFVVARVDGAWTRLAALALPGPGKHAVAFDGGAAVACKDGGLAFVRKTKDGWTATPRAVPGGPARLGADGRRLLVARDDGYLSLVDGEARTEIHGEPASLRGAVFADLDAETPGQELATAGYMGTVAVLYEKDGKWRAETVLTDGAPIHHLAAGDLDPDRAGPELAACGFSKRLTVVGRK